MIGMMNSHSAQHTHVGFFLSPIHCHNKSTRLASLNLILPTVHMDMSKLSNGQVYDARKVIGHIKNCDDDDDTVIVICSYPINQSDFTDFVTVLNGCCFSFLISLILSCNCM